MKKFAFKTVFFGAAACAVVAAGSATAAAVPQPHSEAALRALLHALAELDIAEKEKGQSEGDSKTTPLVKQAIEELRQEIEHRNAP